MNGFPIAICELNLVKLQAVRALLEELQDSEMLQRISGELSVSLDDLEEGVTAIIGAVIEERDALKAFAV